MTHSHEAPWQRAPVPALAGTPVAEPLGSPGSCRTAPGWAEQLWASFLFHSHSSCQTHAGPAPQTSRGADKGGGPAPVGDALRFTQALSPGTASPGNAGLPGSPAAILLPAGRAEPFPVPPPAPGAGEEVICGCPGQAAASSARLRHAVPCLLGRRPVTKRQGWDLPFCCWLCVCVPPPI